MPTNLELRVRCFPFPKALFLIPCGTLASPWELRKPTNNNNNKSNKTLPRWHPRSVKSESYDHWKSLFYSFKQSHCPGLTEFSKSELFIVWMSRTNLQNASLPYGSSGFLTEMLLHYTTSFTFCDQIWFTIIFNNYFFMFVKSIPCSQRSSRSGLANITNPFANYQLLNCHLVLYVSLCEQVKCELAPPR